MKECKCGNYKPYIETMKPGVGYATMMPFTACVNCYGVNQSNKPTIDDLQKENDELRLALGVAESKGAIKLLSGLTGNISNLIKDAEDSGNKDLLLSLMFMQRMIEEYENNFKGGEL